MSRRIMTAILAGAAFGMLGTAQAADVAKTPGKTLGFAVTDFDFAIDRDAATCPKGFALAAKDLSLAQAPAAERLRLLRPENIREFEQKAYRTPDGKDLCTVPDYPRPPQYSPVGSKAPGMAL